MDPTSGFNEKLCENYIATLAACGKSDKVGIWHKDGSFFGMKHKSGEIMKCNFIFAAFLRLIQCFLPDSLKIQFKTSVVTDALNCFKTSTAFQAAGEAAENILDGDIEIDGFKYNSNSDYAKMRPTLTRLTK